MDQVEQFVYKMCCMVINTMESAFNLYIKGLTEFKKSTIQNKITDKNDKKRAKEIITWSNKTLKPIITELKEIKKLKSIEKMDEKVKIFSAKTDAIKPEWDKVSGELQYLLQKYNINIKIGGKLL